MQRAKDQNLKPILNQFKSFLWLKIKNQLDSNGEEKVSLQSEEHKCEFNIAHIQENHESEQRD